MSLGEQRREIMEFMIRILVDKYGVRRSSLHEHTDLESDLRLDGDDLSDFIEDIERFVKRDLRRAFQAIFWPNGIADKGEPVCLAKLYEMILVDQ